MAIEYNKELNTHIIFVNQEKWFHRFDGNIFGETLANYVIKEQLLDNIRTLQRNCHSLVRTTTSLADTFLSIGLRRSYTLSLLLFNVNIARIMNEVQPRKERLLHLVQEDRGQFNDSLNELLYTNDLAYKDEEQHQISSLIIICSKYNMKIIIQQTESMKVNKTPIQLNIQIENTNVQRLSELGYLGSIFLKHGKFLQKDRNMVSKG